MKKPRNQWGLTLIEILVYTGLLATMIVVLTLFAVQVIRRNAHAQLAAQTLDNARGAMAVITQDIRHATGVYSPTSVFSSHPGQLSLVTTQELPAGEDETYVDFYVDDEQLYVKREEAAAEAITSNNVRVTSMTFLYLHQTSSAPAIRVSLTVEPRDTSAQASSEGSVTLTTTASLRSY
ncbi:MAG: PulJ/GspJ family protein [Candidatus Binatia bacterium]